MKCFFTIKKRTILPVKVLMVLFALHLSFITTEAKVRFGVIGGFQLTEMSFSHDALKDNNRLGWFAGPTVKFTLPVVGMGVDVAALFDQRDLKVDDNVFKQKSLVIQGSGRYGVGIGEAIGIFLKLGPQFSFNVGDDFVHWLTTKEEYKQFSLQETMLSINMGAGITFAGHFEADIRYNIPISKTSDFTWSELGEQLRDQTWHHAKSRTSAWNISLTYFF
jgi:hypothetical protein